MNQTYFHPLPQDLLNIIGDYVFNAHHYSRRCAEPLLICPHDYNFYIWMRTRGRCEDFYTAEWKKKKNERAEKDREPLCLRR